MADQRDVLAREVDEELRREQLLKIWERYGTYIIAVAVLIVVGVGGIKFYQHRSALRAEAAGANFVTAAREMAAGKNEEARKQLETVSTTGPGGYAALARLRLAAADAAAGKNAEAIAEFEAVSKISGVDPLLKDYAQLQAATLRLDTANWTDMQNRLNDLASEQNPWRFSARELLGMAAFKAGRTEEARAEFQRLLTDRSTPQGISGRARIMLGVIAQADVAKTAPQVPEKAPEPAPKNDAKSEPKAKTDAKKSN